MKVYEVYSPTYYGDDSYGLYSTHELAEKRLYSILYNKNIFIREVTIDEDRSPY